MIHYDEEKWASQFTHKQEEPSAKGWCIAVAIFIAVIACVVLFQMM